MIFVLYSKENLTFQVLSVNKVVHENGFFDVKGRPFSALAFRIKGRADLQLDNSTISSCSGDIMYVPKNMDYKVTYQDCEYIVVHLVDCNYYTAENINTDNYNFFYVCFKELMEYWNNSRCVNGAKSRIYKIFQKLEEKDNSLSEDEAFNRCRAYMEENFADYNLNISGVCKNNFVSETGLRRKFHTYTKMSPKQYLLKLRIDRAVNLLLEGKYPVKTVAEMSGFYDEKYFSRVIKNKYGIPPSKF